MPGVTVRAISPDQHDAVLHYFDMVAYADNPNWSRCYCMERLAADYDSRTKEQNRADRSELILSAKANGLVAYRFGRVVGWCHAAPKTELLNIEGPKDPKVGAIVCFVVAPDQRRQGVATALLDASLDHLRKRGMTTAEAYPYIGEIEQPARWAQINYVGPVSMYLKAGFEIVAKDKNSAVVRRAL
jgi:GNAT superfamily N-acetyltransferase